MDVLDFNIFVSGRFSYEGARDRMNVSGDTQWAESLLRGLLILY